MKTKIIILLLCIINSLLHAQNRPNIILILADDLRADALGCYGNTYVKTPTLDSLAKAGVRFNNSYILGGDQGAICSPSRAMLMTGRSFFKNSNVIKGRTTLPMVLRQNGYETFMTGKWHNEKEAVVAGFTQAKNIFFGGMDDHFKTAMVDLNADGTFTNAENKGFSTDIFAQSAIDFIEQQTAKKPFFTYIPFTTPHDPRSPLPKYLAQYDAQSMPLPPNYKALHPFSFGNGMDIRDEFLAAFPRTPEIIQAQTADYYGMITHLDDAVARIIRALKAKGLDKNTLIIFSADNGLAMGSHGLMGKQNLYEHSMRIPMIITGAGIPKNKKVDGFTYLMDVFPTVCEYAKLPVPKDIDGKSFNNMILGKTNTHRPEMFTGYITFQRAVRDGRYKLIRFPAINHQLLFDLKNDPHELVNLAEKPEFAQKIKDLTALMIAKQKEFGDNHPLSTNDPKPKEWDYKALKRVPDKWQPPYILEKYFKD